MMWTAAPQDFSVALLQQPNVLMFLKILQNAYHSKEVLRATNLKTLLC